MATLPANPKLLNHTNWNSLIRQMHATHPELGLMGQPSNGVKALLTLPLGLARVIWNALRHTKGPFDVLVIASKTTSESVALLCNTSAMLELNDGELSLRVLLHPGAKRPKQPELIREVHLIDEPLAEHYTREGRPDLIIVEDPMIDGGESIRRWVFDGIGAVIDSAHSSGVPIWFTTGSRNIVGQLELLRALCGARFGKQIGEVLKNRIEHPYCLLLPLENMKATADKGLISRFLAYEAMLSRECGEQPIPAARQDYLKRRMGSVWFALNKHVWVEVATGNVARHGDCDGMDLLTPVNIEHVASAPGNREMMVAAFDQIAKSDITDVLALRILASTMLFSMTNDRSMLVEEGRKAVGFTFEYRNKSGVWSWREHFTRHGITEQEWVHLKEDQQSSTPATLEAACLHHAIAFEDWCHVKHALLCGTDGNARNHDGWTPLMSLAYTSAPTALWQWLIDHGCQPSRIYDRDGLTPAHHISLAANEELAAALPHAFDWEDTDLIDGMSSLFTAALGSMSMVSLLQGIGVKGSDMPNGTTLEEMIDLLSEGYVTPGNPVTKENAVMDETAEPQPCEP